MSAKPEISRP